MTRLAIDKRFGEREVVRVVSKYFECGGVCAVVKRFGERDCGGVCAVCDARPRCFLSKHKN